MNILINCSNISGGGGGQVADSICSYTNIFTQHFFVVVYASALIDMGARISEYKNVESIHYDYPRRDTMSLLTGRNSFLDELVKSRRIDCVLTVFGPMKWQPKCPHLCGFALAQIVIPESPFFKQLCWQQYIKQRISIFLDKIIFCRGTKYLYTENPFISSRVKALFKGSEVRTITNNYNQIYDNRNSWKINELESFNGTSLLTLASPYPHKNIPITIQIAKYLKVNHPEFKFRFVLSVRKEELPRLDDQIEDCFVFLGRVSIEECPSLYEQCDIAFLPSLIECFSAMYAEAMRMGVPIVTSDLPFARGLCNKAALYFNPLSVQEASEAIFNLANNEILRNELVVKGKQQLLTFDTNEQRAVKLMNYCEDICSTI